MNFTEYMNRRIFTLFAYGRVVAIGEQCASVYPADLYVDLADADITCDLERELPDVRADHVRLGEVLEHLTRDADLLRHLRAGRAASLLVTVPFHAPAVYHVRLHSDWSIRALLSATGWRVERYIPRKAPRLDRLAWMLRGVLGRRVNAWMFAANEYLPLRPNGGYYYCLPCTPEEITDVNKREFG